MGNSPHSPSRLTRAAFAGLVERHQHALHAFLRGFIGQDDEARDLVQDTFHAAWRLAQTGAPPFLANSADDEIRRWLFHTAYCRAVSLLRRRRPWASLDAVAEMLPDEREASFDERIVEQESLRAALARLSPEDVTCLLLRIVHGFSAIETGHIIGSTPEAGDKRLSRAKQRLRFAYLDQNAVPEERPIA